MISFKEHDTVVYTDAEGRKIDTFVIFDTDPATGLTHINHENLIVPANALVMHPKTLSGHHMPMHDAFSFELFKTLKQKYQSAPKPGARELVMNNTGSKTVLQLAS